MKTLWDLLPLETKINTINYKFPVNWTFYLVGRRASGERVDGLVDFVGAHVAQNDFLFSAVSVSADNSWLNVLEGGRRGLPNYLDAGALADEDGKVRVSWLQSGVVSADKFPSALGSRGSLAKMDSELLEVSRELSSGGHSSWQTNEEKVELENEFYLNFSGNEESDWTRDLLVNSSIIIIIFCKKGKESKTNNFLKNIRIIGIRRAGVPLFPAVILQVWNSVHVNKSSYNNGDVENLMGLEHEVEAAGPDAFYRMLRQRMIIDFTWKTRRVKGSPTDIEDSHQNHPMNLTFPKRDWRTMNGEKMGWVLTFCTIFD